MTPRRKKPRQHEYIKGARYSLRFPTKQQALEAIGLHYSGSDGDDDKLYGWLMRRLTEKTASPPSAVHGNPGWLRITVYGRQRIYIGEYYEVKTAQNGKKYKIRHTVPILTVLINAFLDLAYPDEHLPNKLCDLHENLAHLPKRPYT